MDVYFKVTIQFNPIHLIKDIFSDKYWLNAINIFTQKYKKRNEHF